MKTKEKAVLMKQIFKENDYEVNIKTGFDHIYIKIKSGKCDKQYINHYHYKDEIKDNDLVLLLDKIMDIYRDGISYRETGDYGSQPSQYINITFVGDYQKNN